MSTRPTIEFKKITIDGEDVVSIDFAEQTEKGPKECSDTYPFKPHDDFKAAFQALVPHVCVLAEQYDENGNKIPATHDPSKDGEAYMRVCGLSLSGKGDKARIVFTAVRYLSSGKAITINTPALAVSLGENNTYSEKEDLQKVLKRVKEEALAFLQDEKYALDPQGKLEFVEAEEN